MTRTWMTGMFLASSLLLGGCTTYYSVTDPTTGKTYYTTDYKEDDGSVHFTDAASEARVNINNSEVREISKDQYRAGMAAAKMPKASTTVTTPASGTTTVSTPATTVTTSPGSTTVTTPDTTTTTTPAQTD